MNDSRFIPPQPDRQEHDRIAGAIVRALMSSKQKQLTFSTILLQVRRQYPAVSARSVQSVLADLQSQQRVQGIEFSLPYGRRSVRDRYAEALSDTEERLI
nr:hypothetical protein [Rhodococcus wratislaviensis]GLK38665.1 hypothetical protein GCM10017611_55320 [Rhodococcus wratislaviensis]